MEMYFIFCETKPCAKEEEKGGETIALNFLFSFSNHQKMTRMKPKEGSESRYIRARPSQLGDKGNVALSLL